MRTHDIMMADFCDALCYMEPNCASYNLRKRSEPEGHKCELNNATHEGNENDLEKNQNYVYRGTKVKTTKGLNLNVNGILLFLVLVLKYSRTSGNRFLPKADTSRKLD